MLLSSQLRRIAARSIKLQPKLSRKARNGFLIRVGLRPAQLMVEMNDRKDDAEFTSQLQQHPEHRHEIDPARNGNPNSISGTQQFLAADVAQHVLRQGMHGNMVSQWRTGARQTTESLPELAGGAGYHLHDHL